MNVPSELYEAAQIDGATKRQAFFNITIPYIIFVTTPYLITSFIGNITSFNVIFLLTVVYQEQLEVRLPVKPTCLSPGSIIDNRTKRLQSGLSYSNHDLYHYRFSNLDFLSSQ
jgi:hypothetical protein